MNPIQCGTWRSIFDKIKYSKMFPEVELFIMVASYPSLHPREPSIITLPSPNNPLTSLDPTQWQGYVTNSVYVSHYNT